MKLRAMYQVLSTNILGCTHNSVLEFDTELTPHPKIEYLSFKCDRTRAQKCPISGAQNDGPIKMSILPVRPKKVKTQESLCRRVKPETG